jgi:general secretion pathway protein D
MACSIQALYGQLSGYGGYGGGQSSIQACMGPTGTGGNGFGNTYGGGGFGSSGSGGGGFGGGQGNGGYGAGGFGGGQYGGMNNGGGYGYNPYAAGGGGSPFSNAAAAPAPGVTGTPGTPGAGDLTGTYLGIVPGGGFGGRGPRVIANPMNNTLLVQATAQEYESILQLIKELDIPPRQVLIEAKIYSIDLSHTFSSDVTAALT